MADRRKELTRVNRQIKDAAKARKDHCERIDVEFAVPPALVAQLDTIALQKAKKLTLVAQVEGFALRDPQPEVEQHPAVGKLVGNLLEVPDKLRTP